MTLYIQGMVGLLILAAAWLFLAPIQIGGKLIYLIVTGSSMEPAMSNGDLAVLRQSQDFQVGDVVLYQHPKIGPVIHRIIALEEDRYLLQGDHNDWEDSYLPTSQEIAGELWFNLPYAGKMIRGFRSPVGAALLAGFLGFFLFWPESKQVDEL